MERPDADAHTQKRPRLDSVNPPLNGLLPPHLPHSQHSNSPASGRHYPSPYHSSQASPPGPGHYQPHPPQHQQQPQHLQPQYSQQPHPPQHQPQQHQPPQHQPQQHQPRHPQQSHPHPHPHPPPSSVPPSDHRAYPERETLRPVLSPTNRPHGFPVTLLALPAAVDRDRISDYARPSLPAPSPAPAPVPEQSPRSTTADGKPQAGMDHGGPGHSAPWPANPDHRPNGSYPNPNGYGRVVSPTHSGHSHEQQYQSPHVPAEHHVPAGQHVPVPTEHHVPTGPHASPAEYAQGGPYTPQPYMGGSAQYPSQQKRKQVRAQQACNHCRARKQKCDEQRPCMFCRENNLSHDCQYREVPPPKQDRSMMQLQETVNILTDTVNNQASKLDAVAEMLKSLVKDLKNNSGAQSYATRQSISGHSHQISSIQAESPNLPYANGIPLHAPRPSPSQFSTSRPSPSQFSTPRPSPSQSSKPDAAAVNGIFGEVSVSESSLKGGLRSDHTTPAHQVLQDWPSMKTFREDIAELDQLRKERRPISEYPMWLEKSRGIMRVNGIGEDVAMDNYGTPESQSQSQIGTPEVLTPAGERDAVWGKIDAITPSAERDAAWGKIDAASPSTLGGDTPQESLDALKLDKETMVRLYHSYYNHMHLMHPFMNPVALKKAMNEFSDMYGPEAAKRPLKKRKWSASALGDTNYSATDAGKSGGLKIDRTIGNAIVLLVLALGKVTECSSPLPSPSSSMLSGGPSSTYPSPHSVNSSFSSDSGNGTTSRPKNIDILPGMAYFSIASGILGDHQGGLSTAHAQANILAGLYMGQYARVLESWTWISNACRICVVLIKANLKYITREDANSPDENEPHKSVWEALPQKTKLSLNQIKCVYWTCLQLETDILAEMSALPPSDISKYQSEIMYPSGVKDFSEDTPDVIYSEDDKTMWLYSSQIHLRVLLNEAHNTLYNRDGALNLDLEDTANAAQNHASYLSAWKKEVPNWLQWNDTDPPPTDINIARLRAKYYGGLYIILRPYLYKALTDMELPPQSGSTSSNSTIVALNTAQSSALRISADCINAAMKSTIAFDRVGADPNSRYQDYAEIPTSRFIVTNIFGTMHAQFGNMIVLSAVFNSKIQKLLEAECNSQLTHTNLSFLVRRTITKLKELAPNSPTLSLDAKILENVQRKLGLLVD